MVEVKRPSSPTYGTCESCGVATRLDRFGFCVDTETCEAEVVYQNGREHGAAVAFGLMGMALALYMRTHCPHESGRQSCVECEVDDLPPLTEADYERFRVACAKGDHSYGHGEFCFWCGHQDEVEEHT